MTPTQVAFKPSVLARYPEQDRSDIIFPPHTSMVPLCMIFLLSLSLSSSTTVMLFGLSLSLTQSIYHHHLSPYAQFCYPRGILFMEHNPPKPLFFPIVLTAEDGAQLYGSCLTFYERLDPSEIEEIYRSFYCANADSLGNNFFNSSFYLIPCSLHTCIAYVSIYQFLIVHTEDMWMIIRSTMTVLLQKSIRIGEKRQ